MKKNYSSVLQILCGPNHLYAQDDFGENRNQKTKKFKNLVLEFIEKEIKLDHYYDDS